MIGSIGRALSVSVAIVSTVVAAPQAYAQARYTFDLRPQALEGALKAVASKTGNNIVFSPAAVAGRSSPALRGSFSAGEAIRRLIEASGLVAKQTAGGSWIISAPVASTARRQSASASQENAAQAASRTAAASEPDSSSNEILVTAQKRTERLLEVPVPVSAITADQLRDTNRLRLADYFSQVPGLSYTTAAVGDAVTVSIRGLSSGGGGVNPTVGFTVDDVPYGSARSDGGSYALPEIDPGDLQRMEVLRGPQGTLYGASSLGGLIKYVTVQPSLAGIEGEVSAGLNVIENQDGPGYRAYGAINLPVAGTLAIRTSAFTRRSPGYIENPLRDIEGIGTVTASGGRIAALWEPSATFSLTLTGYYQESEQDGALRAANPTSPYRASRNLPMLGWLQQDDFPGTGVTRKDIQGYNATARLGLGNAELTSITGYHVTDLRSSTDDNRDWGYFTGSTEDVFGPAVPNGSAVHNFDARHELKKVSQELRLTVPIGERFDALVGLFYTHEDYAGGFVSHYLNAVTAQEVALRDIAAVDFRYSEWAGFANLTARVTDKFDVQVGARRARNEGTYQGINRGPHIGGAPLGPPRIGEVFNSSEHVWTYLVTPRYRFSDDRMLYARVSTGYRPGGFNPLNQFGTPYPPYNSDSSKNYEVGFKGTFFDDDLTIDASAYLILWDDIQIQAIDESWFLYFENGSAARSRGVELSVSARPIAGLDVSGWVAFGRAELTEDFPGTATVAGKKGDRLPLSSEVSGSISATQEFPLFADVTGFVGGTFTYVDDHLGNFSSIGGGPRERIDGYQTVDLRLGARNDRWNAGLYVTNVTNERGLISGDEDYLVPIRPREFGLNLSRVF